MADTSIEALIGNARDLAEACNYAAANAAPSPSIVPEALRDAAHTLPLVADALDAAKCEREEARKALEPFAAQLRIAEEQGQRVETVPDTALWLYTEPRYTVGQYRRLAALAAKLKEGE